jgi:FMN-dependent oxidoreductase (nitrilotriacetate monooxygenase family)
MERDQIRDPRQKTMKLGAFLHPSGHHIASWRHPRSCANGHVDFNHYAKLAQIAERGKFDTLFLADSPGVRAWPIETTSRVDLYVAPFEPLTLLSALVPLTNHIGLAATVTTTYNEPFHVARKFASLDHLSKGRAGWNLVTSVNSAEAFNFGYSTHPLHEDRYRRAEEFAAVVRGLWDTWDDDAFVYDRHSGRYFEPDRMHLLNHEGQYFKVRGPLNVARSPQGHPVVIEAGSSEPGKALAARNADVMFTLQSSLPSAKAFYADMKGRLAEHGRQPEDLKILPGLFPVVGRSTSEAQERFEELQSLVHPNVGRQLLGEILGGVDLSAYPVDNPPPPIDEASYNYSKTALGHAQEMAASGLTIKQLYLRLACGRGHLQVIGTAQGVADQMEAWFRNEACDGFNILPPCLPSDLTDFVDLVVPELQKRGLFRAQYEGKTLRENLGLRRPPGKSTVCRDT